MRLATLATLRRLAHSRISEASSLQDIQATSSNHEVIFQGRARAANAGGEEFSTLPKFTPAIVEGVVAGALSGFRSAARFGSCVIFQSR